LRNHEDDEALSPNFNEYEIYEDGNPAYFEKQFSGDHFEELSPGTACPTTQMTTEYNEQETFVEEEKLRQAYSVAMRSDHSRRMAESDNFHEAEKEMPGFNHKQEVRSTDFKNTAQRLSQRFLIHDSSRF